MKPAWTWGALAVVVGLGVVAVAEDSSSPWKRKRKPAPVNIVQSVPLDVTLAGATPLPVDVASLPAVTVASLPQVNVASLPSVTVANPTLDVRVTNASVSVAPASNATVVLGDLNGVTVSSDFTSADIDCDGYRAASVFVSSDPFTIGGPSSDMSFRLEFGCNGIFALERGATTPNLGGGAEPLLVSSDVLGSRLRVRFFRENANSGFPTINNLRVVVYLRR